MEFLELLKNMKQSPSLSEDQQKKLNDVLSNIGENVAELAGLLLKAYHLIPENTPIDIRRPEFVGSSENEKRPTTATNGSAYLNQSDNANASAATPPSPPKKRKRFPDEPKPPRSSFFHYLEDARKKLITDGLPAGTDAIAQTKIIAVQWKNLSDEQKQFYTIKALEDRNRYDRDIDLYCQQYPDRAPDVMQEAKKFRRSSEKRKADLSNNGNPIPAKGKEIARVDEDGRAGHNILRKHSEAPDDDDYFVPDNQFAFKMEEDSLEEEEEEIDEINDSETEEGQHETMKQKANAH